MPNHGKTNGSWTPGNFSAGSLIKFFQSGNGPTKFAVAAEQFPDFCRGLFVKTQATGIIWMSRFVSHKALADPILPLTRNYATIRLCWSRWATSSIGGGHLHHVFSLLGRHDAKPFFGFIFAGELAVMAEDHLWTIARLQRCLGGVLGDGEPVAAKRVAQSVAFPFEFSLVACCLARPVYGDS
jgi:hypothetical protein